MRVAVAVLLLPAVTMTLAAFAAEDEASAEPEPAAEKKPTWQEWLNANAYDPIRRCWVPIPEGVEPLWIEDIAARIGIGRKLAAFALAFVPPRPLERACGAQREVTADDVREAANALLDRDRLTMLAVGNVDGMECAWSRFAENLGVDLREIDLE